MINIIKGVYSYRSIVQVKLNPCIEVKLTINFKLKPQEMGKQHNDLDIPQLAYPPSNVNFDFITIPSNAFIYDLF